MSYSQRWPLVAAMLQQDETPYVLPNPRQVEWACALGERELSGQSLMFLRLDMALAGLMQEFGEDYFHGDLFPDRFSAAEEVLLAARVFLEQQLPNREQQEERVRLLQAEAETVLEQWNQLLVRGEKQTMLFAAEEAAELG